MASWTAADVVSVAPEFAGVAGATIDLFASYADLQINPDAYGPRAKLAGILLTAHLLTLFPQPGSVAGPPGLVVSETIGGVSTTYAIPIDLDLRAGLALSRYGAEFARLSRQNASGVQVT